MTDEARIAQAVHPPGYILCVVANEPHRFVENGPGGSRHLRAVQDVLAGLLLREPGRVTDGHLPGYGPEGLQLQAVAQFGLAYQP